MPSFPRASESNKDSTGHQEERIVVTACLLESTEWLAEGLRRQPESSRNITKGEFGGYINGPL